MRKEVITASLIALSAAACKGDQSPKHQPSRLTATQGLVPPTAQTPSPTTDIPTTIPISPPPPLPLEPTIAPPVPQPVNEQPTPDIAALMRVAQETAHNNPLRDYSGPIVMDRLTLPDDVRAFAMGAIVQFESPTTSCTTSFVTHCGRVMLPIAYHCIAGKAVGDVVGYAGHPAYAAYEVRLTYFDPARDYAELEPIGYPSHGAFNTLNTLSPSELAAYDRNTPAAVLNFQDRGSQEETATIYDTSVVIAGATGGEIAVASPRSIGRLGGGGSGGPLLMPRGSEVVVAGVLLGGHTAEQRAYYASLLNLPPVTHEYDYVFFATLRDPQACQ